jgi:hypothetical protein
MQVKNVDGLSLEQIRYELDRGGKFVTFDWVLSLLVVTLKLRSDIYFVRDGESAAAKGMPFILLTLLLGWWGIPWGPIRSIASIFTNIMGGTDVTFAVLEQMPMLCAPHDKAAGE